MATSDETGMTEPRRSAEDYCKAIKHAERYFEEWHRVCDNVDRALSDLERLAKGGGDREMQVFWANWEVMVNQVYSRSPVPVVTQRHTTSELRRQTAMTLERCAVTAFDDMDIDYTLRLVRDDMVAASRGVAWVSYRAKGETREDFIESVDIEQLDRQDFLHEPGRKWPEVGWVAKRSWLTKQEFRKRFPDVPVDEIHWVKQEDDIGGEVMKAAVYEVWDRVENTVVWVHEGYLDEVLDEKEPWLKLKGFFPCPRPAYAMTQRRTLIPVPEYVYISDQLDEINTLTARISALTESLRLKGFMPAGTDDIGQAVETALREMDDRAVVVPVANFAAFGGASLKDSIVWLPVVEVAATIMNLIEIRRQTIDDLYQVSGISDIQRGDSDPNETLGAQQLKAANSASRIRSKQAEMVRFARDLIVIAAEIIAEEFGIETIAVMSQTDLPRRADIQAQASQMQQQMMQMQMQLEEAQRDPLIMQQAEANPEQAQQMMQQAQQQMQGMQQQLEELMETVTLDDVADLLADEKLRPFVLDVESDSTIQPDEQAEKQARAEFTAAIGGLLEQAVPAVQAVPALAPLIGETIRFNAAAFRQGRQLQDEIDDFIDKLKNGEIGEGDDGKAEAERAKAEIEAQKLQLEQQRMAMEAQLAQQKAMVEQEQAQQKLAVERATAELDAESRRGEMVRDQQRFEIEQQTARMSLQKIDAEIKRIEAQAQAAARKPESVGNGSGSRD